MLKYFNGQAAPGSAQTGTDEGSPVPARKKIDNSKARWWAMKFIENRDGQCAECCYENTLDTEPR